LHSFLYTITYKLCINLGKQILEVLQLNRYRSNFAGQASPFLRFLNDDQLQEIHQSSVEVLERVGVRVDHAEALQLLKAAGCRVDGTVARIPGPLVEECIRLASHQVTIGNRQGTPAFTLAPNYTFFGTGSDLPFQLDRETGERRRSQKIDIIEAATLMDYLPNFDFIMSYGIPSDCSAEDGDLHQFEAMVLNCSKPIVFTALTAGHTRKICEMAAAAVGGRDKLAASPFIMLYSEPISPLIHTTDGIEKMFVCIEYGVPVIYTPGVVAGGTCPVTKAGTAVQMNAESLSGLVIAQLKKKGATIIIGGGATPMDMRSSATLYGSPDAMMNYCTMSELARFYRLPNFTEAGCSNAPVPDAQAGMEASMSILMNQLCGANIVHDVGYLDGGKLGSLPFLVMCEDFISAARHIGAGVRVDKDTMAVDAIAQTGPAGQYLTSPHTLKHFRKEIWQPMSLNYMMWDIWEEQGKKTLFDKAKEKTGAILSEHKSTPLPDERIQQIKHILTTKK
jgi:trimethylamine--corrinoid protein Co-methyltransferase